MCLVPSVGLFDCRSNRARISDPVLRRQNHGGPGLQLKQQ